MIYHGRVEFYVPSREYSVEAETPEEAMEKIRALAGADANIAAFPSTSGPDAVETPDGDLWVAIGFCESTGRPIWDSMVLGADYFCDSEGIMWLAD